MAWLTSCLTAKQAFAAWKAHAQHKQELQLRLAALLRRLRRGTLGEVMEGLRMHAECARAERARAGAAMAAMRMRAAAAAFSGWLQLAQVKADTLRKVRTCVASAAWH